MAPSPAHRLHVLSARIAEAVEMSIRLKDGYVVNRTPLMDEGTLKRRDERMISVLHPEGGGYTYTRKPAGAPLEYLRVPKESRGRGRAKALLDHFVAHLDHRQLPSSLEVAPTERGITPQGLRKLYASRGWKGAGREMVRAARSTVR